MKIIKRLIRRIKLRRELAKRERFAREFELARLRYEITGFSVVIIKDMSYNATIERIKEIKALLNKEKEDK